MSSSLAAPLYVGQKVYNDGTFNTATVLQSYRQVADYFTQFAFGTYTSASTAPINVQSQAGKIGINGTTGITVGTIAGSTAFTVTIFNPLITGKTIFHMTPSWDGTAATSPAYGFVSIANVVGAQNGVGTHFAVPGSVNAVLYNASTNAAVAHLHYELVNPLVLQ